MIEILKSRVEEKIGKKIVNRGDCQLLSNAILDLTGNDISYNTIRRLYGIIAPTKPSIRTLNSLALFVGYENFIHFTLDHDLKEKYKTFGKLFKLISTKDKNQILEAIQSFKNSQVDFVEMITILLRDLFRDKDYKLIDEIFRMDELNYRNFSYSELLYIGNCIGLIFRKQGFFDDKLMDNVNFLHCVYLTFVDYSSLNGYYGQWLEHVKREEHGGEIEIFTDALVELKKFLNGKKVNYSQHDLVYSGQLNPILCSRVLSLNFLQNEIKNVDDLLSNYYQTHSKRSNLTDYSYELFITSILIKNVEIMAFLIGKLNFKVDFYYQKSHRNSFYLMCGFYYKIIGHKQKEIDYMKLFDIDEFRYSYDEFITVLYLIYSFHNTVVESEQEGIKKRYINATTKMGYDYFDEAYLENYFEKAE